ncbi:MAG: Gfo/Idh/MocA family oxidoreductase [Candidatus Hydrogenedentes bacterium]|nr:Gfo/Idh/MocA family oxidoreductase [Candidatus Hydrogenedentota bacterium]
MPKIAVVGCGGIMEEHFRHLQGMSEVCFVGHCDTDKERAESAAARFGGEVFSDSALMFDKTKPDAVYVCVPPFARGAIETAAAERGIHLFIEKPVALDRTTAARVEAAIRRFKVMASVGYCYRYCDSVTKARQLLKGKAVSLVSAWYACGMPEVWWWRQRARSGGQILEQTTHLFDLVRYLCGDVAEVYGVAARGCMNQVDQFDVDDSSAVTMRLKSGAAVSIVSSCVANNGGQTGLKIVTPEATIEFDRTTLRVCEGDVTTEYRSGADMYEEENKAFIDAITSGKRNRIRSTYSDARKTLMATLAANESIGSGLPQRP